MSEKLRRSLGYVLDKLPYISDLRRVSRQAGGFPPGHFYSPVPSEAEVQARVQSIRATGNEPAEIQFHPEQQFEVLQSFARFYDQLPFPQEADQGNGPAGSCRYFYNQSVFCYPDAIFLYSFLRKTKPARIIEVGSGFSSAVILDTIDRFFPAAPEITFVEPYPESLRKLLRAEDTKAATVIAEKVQNAPMQLFEALGPGDLLFIDSSHVMKCGSDLQFLLFDVLPRLPAGVYVHFHDIFRTFEYPEDWLRRGWYWNEAYFLRAFLANNSAWQIYFFNNYVRKHFADYLSERMPLCMKDIGGSLYIRKTA